MRPPGIALGLCAGAPFVKDGDPCLRPGALWICRGENRLSQDRFQRSSDLWKIQLHWPLMITMAPTVKTPGRLQMSGVDCGEVGHSGRWVARSEL